MKSFNRVALLVLGVSLAGCASAAQAQLVMNVRPSSAPNVFGSPSWASYNTNALNSLSGNLGNIGNRNTDPTAYEIAGPYIDPGDVIVSGFSSWRGVANSPAPFNAEFGNRLHFGLSIVGGGTNPMFRLNDLTFNMSSGDTGNSLVFAGNFVGLSYSATRFGVDFGANRVEGGGDDVIYTSGNGLSLVDKIVYVGVGNAFDATSEPGATNQDKMDSAIAYIVSEAPFDITCTYTMFAPNGTTVLGAGTGSVIVPTPGMVTLAFVGALGFIRRARQR